MEDKNIRIFDDYIKTWIGKYNSKITETEEKINDYNSISICSKTNAYHILQVQPKASLLVDKDIGLVIKDNYDIYQKKLYQAITQSFNTKYDLVLTPEYSVPIDLIIRVVDEKEQIFDGTLYCLCCNGVTCKEFDNLMSKLKQKGIEIYQESWNFLDKNRIVCALIYITKIKFFKKNGDIIEKVFFVPQFKTRAMKDDLMIFEYDTLSCGHQVILFGKEKENTFLSIICADVFNYNLITRIKNEISNKLIKKAIVFHPQLNSRPQNNNFRFTRDLFLDYADVDSIRVIALNWAKGTEFNIGEEKRIAITDSWSAIYKVYLNDNFERDLKVLDDNANKGLNFAHDYQVSMFFFPSKEYLIDISMKALIDENAASVLRGTVFLTVNDYFEYDKTTFQWLEKTDLCKEMVDFFFWDCDEFQNFFETNKTGIKCCKIAKLNKWFSLIYNSKIEKQFEMINNGSVSSATAKHYKSIYSKEKIYICKRIYNYLKKELDTKKYNFQKTKFEFDVIISESDIAYNLRYYDTEFGEQVCRVIYLKYAQEKDAEKLYSDIYKYYEKSAENLLIFYENENGTNFFDKNIDTSILKGEVAQNNISIMGGAPL